MSDKIMEEKRKKAWADLNKAIEENKIGFANDQATQFSWFFLTDLDRRLIALGKTINDFYEVIKGHQEIIGLLTQQKGS